MASTDTQFMETILTIVYFDWKADTEGDCLPLSLQNQHARKQSTAINSIWNHSFSLQDNGATRMQPIVKRRGAPVPTSATTSESSMFTASAYESCTG
jgi:hypothetical protein